ncbi:MAG TPA: nuclear transport factor 2 family protein [Opitutaceae bacterium]|nr:nuclear transport factor 2 family protein [Opitutaceae bacterium]
MRHFLPRIFLCALCGGILASAHAAESPAVSAVLRADQARLAAMMAGDGPALGRLMSDELKFVHSDGRIESKTEYVKNVMAGDTAYTDAKTSEVQAVEPAPNVVVLIGAQEMRKRLGAAWSEVRLRYMAVWRNENGTWRMFAWQSMRPAGNSTVPRDGSSKSQTPSSR